MRTSDRFELRDIIIVYILSYLLLPVVARFTSTYLTTYFYMLFAVGIIIVTIVNNMRIVDRFFRILLPFILYQMLTAFLPKDDFVLWGYNAFLFFLPLVLGIYLVYSRSNKIIKVYSIILTLFLLITAITTIIGCIRYPNASRDLAMVSDSKSEDFVRYNWLNIGDYYFVYACVLLFPVVILAYKLKKIPLILLAGFVVLCYLEAIITEYTIAFILLMISSILLFTRRALTVKGVLLLFIVGMIMIIVFPDRITDFLRWLSSIVGSDQMSERLITLSGGQVALQNAEDNRWELYKMSIASFLQHPLLGSILSGNYKIGGHSFILDNLGQFGILGGIIMFYMYRFIYQFFYKPLYQQIGYGYVVWGFLQAIILSVFNTGIWLEVLCLYAPLLFATIYGTEVFHEVTVDSQLAAGSTG